MTTQKYRSDPVEIANTFCNNYFTNVGHNLPKKIPNSPNCPQTFLSGNFPNSIFLKLATESEIMEVASSFSSGKAAGFDTIPRSIIKQSINVISQPLTNIINLSIIYGIVPDEIKIAWKSHIYISHVANKISKSIGIIFRSSFYLLDTSLRILYYSITYPYLEYCNLVWAST